MQFYGKVNVLTKRNHPLLGLMLIRCSQLFLLFLFSTTMMVGKADSTLKNSSKAEFTESFKQTNHNDMDTIKLNFDGLKKDNWSAAEVQNVKLVLDFVQHLMNNHDFDYVLENYSNSAYLQHNRNITNGLQELVDYVAKFAKRSPDYTYDVKHIYADGDYVIFQSHATIKKKDRGNDKKGFNIKDTWKVVDGKIVEHWDAIQPLDAGMRFFVWMSGGKIRNANGVF